MACVCPGCEATKRFRDDLAESILFRGAIDKELDYKAL